MPSIYKAFASEAPAMVDFFRAQGAILTSVEQSSYGMVGGWFVFLLDRATFGGYASASYSAM